MTFLPETWADLLRPLIAGILAYGSIMLLTRLSGQRMFSKIWPFDLAVTVSIGSLLAAITINGSVAILSGLFALCVVFGLQMLAAKLRSVGVIDPSANSPLLLMDEQGVVEENLRKAKITRSDIMSVLRQHGVLSFAEVKAVVMESDGQLSVLKGGPDDAVHPDLLAEVSRRGK